MDTPKSSFIAAGTTASTILFLVFCGWTIYDSQGAKKVSELGIETVAPENLKRATEVFQLKLKVEAKGFPVDAMMQTKAWEGLVRSAEGYSERLELLERQNRQRSVAVSVISALAALGMALFAWLERKGRKKARRGGLKSSPGARGESAEAGCLGGADFFEQAAEELGE